MFRPGTIEVAAGMTVEWVNQDKTLHTVTSGTPSSRQETFDGQLAGADATFSYTFDEPGTYAYFCALHAQMTAEVIVE